MRDHYVKKRMYRIAKPIIDILLSDRSETERRDLLKRIVCKTKSINWMEGPLWYIRLKEILGFMGLGYFALSGHIFVNDNDEDAAYAHELGHALGKYVRNHAETMVRNGETELK